MKTNGHKFLAGLAAIAMMLMNGLRADGQSAEIGARYMPTFSSLRLTNQTGGQVKGEVTMGYGVGGFLAANFNDNVGLQLEGIYTSISQKYVDHDVEKRIHLNYVNIPLLLSLNSGKSNPVNLNLVGGPQLGISVGSEIESSANGAAPDTLQAVVAVKRGDVGLAYGAGIDFGLNPAQTVRLGFGFRGVFGLVDISDRSNTVVTDSYYILDRTHISTYSGYIGLSVMF